MSKRKYKIAQLSDEEEEKSENLGGLNLFRKLKAAETENSKPGISKNISEGSEIATKIQNATTPKAEEHKSKEETLSQQTASAKLALTKQGEMSKTNPSCKNFRETFAANSNKKDVFDLPPMPEPKEKVVPKNKNNIIVNSRQRGNPILKHIRNIPWEYGDIIPDYEIGERACALYLSMRYHSLNPDYIHERLKKLGNMYDLRVLLVQVDVVNSKPGLKELGRIAMYSNLTMILAWTFEEAGRYLETYKSYEFKPPDIIQQRTETDHLSKVQDFLTTVKSVNKTDVLTLLSTFGSVLNIVNATKQELGDCPGFGSQKATRLYQAFNEPFKSAHSKQDESTEFRQTKLTSYSSKLPKDCKLRRPSDVLSNSQIAVGEDNEAEKDDPLIEKKTTVKDISKKKAKSSQSDKPKEKQTENQQRTDDTSTEDSKTAKSKSPYKTRESRQTLMSKSEAIHSFMKNKDKPPSTFETPTLSVNVSPVKLDQQPSKNKTVNTTKRRLPSDDKISTNSPDPVYKTSLKSGKPDNFAMPLQLNSIKTSTKASKLSITSSKSATNSTTKFPEKLEKPLVDTSQPVTSITEKLGMPLVNTSKQSSISITNTTAATGKTNTNQTTLTQEEYDDLLADENDSDDSLMDY